MIRNDFVSNSSSSSFIIPCNSDIDVDLNFLRILSCIKNFLIFYNDSGYSEDIKNLIKNNSNYSFYDDETGISPKSIQKEDLDIIKKIISESKHIYCNCGEDYDSTDISTQICTVLELYYNILVECEDHFEYTSVRDILDKEI